MKITIEPTVNVDDYPTASVSVPYDDIDIQHVFEDLVVPALLAMGYQKGSIDDYLGTNDE